MDFRPKRWYDEVMLPIHKLIKEGPALENVLEQLRNRRSVRKYKADMVPQEILDQIIEAGLYAPSGKGPVSYTHLTLPTNSLV